MNFTEVSISSKDLVITILPTFPPLYQAHYLVPAPVVTWLSKMLFWTSFLFCLTQLTVAPTTCFCPVMVSEQGLEARRAANPLLLGSGLAESSRKGRKSHLEFPHLLVCLTECWKPFSFALGQYQEGWWLRNQGLSHVCMVYLANCIQKVVQCKSEKTWALNVSVQLDFELNPNV